MLPFQKRDAVARRKLPSLVFVLATPVLFAMVFVAVSALAVTVFYPPNWGPHPSVEDRIFAYLIHAVYSAIFAGRAAFATGAVLGVWFTFRWEVRSASLLMAEAVAIASGCTLTFRELSKHRMSACTLQDFACSPEFWWLSWMVLSATAVLCGYLLRKQILVFRENEG
jgi:hypothetical protein